MGAESTVTLRAVLRDEISAALRQIQAQSASASKDMAQHPKEAAGEWGKLKEAFGDLQGKIPALGSAMDGLGAATKIAMNPIVAIPGLMAAASMAAIHFAESNAEATVELVHMSQKTGISVNALAALKKQGEFAGVGIETIGMAVGRLNVQLGKNSEGFQKLGIDTKDPLQALAQLADKMKASESASERARIGQAAMGRGYKELLPLLIQGGDAIRKAAESHVLSEGMISRYEDIHHQNIQIEQAWGSIKSLIGDLASGPLESVLDVAGGIAKQFADAARSWREMHGQKVDAENVKSIFHEINVSGEAFNDQGGLISSQGMINNQMHRLQLTYNNMGIEARKTFIAGFNQLSDSDMNEAKQQFGDKFIAQIGAWQAQINRMPKPKEGEGELSDKQKALLDKQAEALAKYQEQNEISEIQHNNKYSAEADKKIAAIEVRFRKEEKLLQAHGALLVEMEKAKNNEIDKLQKDALAKSMSIENEDRKRDREILEERQNRALEEQKLDVAAAQHRLDAKSIRASRPYSFSQYDIDTSESESLKRSNPAQKRIDDVSKSIEIVQAKNEQSKIDEIRERYALKEVQRQHSLSEALKKEHEERIKMVTKEADIAQGFAAKELSTALHGKMTMKQLETDFTDLLIEQFAQRSTKWIENLILEQVFSKTAEAGASATSVAAAAPVMAAWGPASLAASIGTFGVASGTGSAAWFNAMAAGTALSSVPMHANGGFEMGGRFIAGERGAEMVRSVVPTQITQASHTTNNTNASTNHFHFYGATESTIMKVFRNAGMNGKGVSRV